MLAAFSSSSVTSKAKSRLDRNKSLCAIMDSAAVKLTCWLLLLVFLQDGCCLKGPRLVEVEKTMETQVDINWTPVASSKVTQYTVRAVPLKNYAPHLGGPLEWKYTDASRAELFGLSAGTLYNVSVWAETSDGPSETTSIFAWTQVGEPDRPPPVEVLSRDGPRMVVRVARGTSTKGPITGYRLIAFEESSLMSFKPERLVGHKEASEAGTPFYLAAELGPDHGGREFVLGAGSSHGGFFNAPLLPGEKYLPIQGVASTLNGITKYAYSVVAPDASAGGAEEQVMTGELPRGPPTRAALVSLLSVAVGVCTFLLAAFVVAYLLLRRHYGKKKRRSEEMILQCHPPPDPETEDGPFCAGALQLGEGADLGAFYGQLRAMFWQVPRPQLLVRDTTLGQGRFGPVRAGVVHRDGSDLSVGVQRCSAQWMLPDRDRRQLLAEIEGMVRLGVHPNVVLFIGACEDQEFLQLVVEHPPRSLRGLLLTSRHSSEGRVCSLEERQLLELAKGVAAGMSHLARHGVHHGQLSTRSITVVDDLVPKISNFGLARYTPLGKKLDFARWLAPESVKTGSHTAKSDVWSYGVLLWEVFTLGGTPYVNLKTAEVAERVTRGLRLSQPKGVRENMYQLMLQCWELDRDERPTFEQMLGSLQEMLCGEIPVKFSHTPGYTYERFDPLADET